jgi:cellulose synthase/poly-beta-1,6-N-acetylglucosamine synthase-like glycosyltransferase
VIGLVTTAALIWSEGIFATRHPGAPETAGSPEVPATAIICAYLPNEADTIVETVEHFMTIDYPAGLQVILAYNTPRDLPVEDDLRELVSRHPRLLLLRVPASNSKAQNLNAGLAQATGEFVGVFDADHHPDPDAFHRAWRWLSNGYSAVQGHCLVRNGGDSFLARMVAVEFESMYAVSHPGRYLRDRFGIFGGSNGFWRTDALHLTRMRGSMLTEDIDASMRLLESGGKIASDPQLISRELGTTTARQIWNQRLRWAQGWFQVSIRHVFEMLRMPHFTTRQKLGIFNLLLQREVYPWISLQIFPLVAFWIARGDVLDWFVPIFVATTIFTSTVGPGSVGFAYRQAHPDIKRHKAWFWQYLVFSTLVYTEAKNIIGRVAQLKQAMGETSWRVTPRSADPAPGFPRLPELKKTAELESDFDSPGVGSEQGSAPLAAVSEAAGAADL